MTERQLVLEIFENCLDDILDHIYDDLDVHGGEQETFYEGETMTLRIGYSVDCDSEYFPATQYDPPETVYSNVDVNGPWIDEGSYIDEETDEDCDIAPEILSELERRLHKPFLRIVDSQTE